MISGFRTSDRFSRMSSSLLSLDCGAAMVIMDAMRCDAMRHATLGGIDAGYGMGRCVSNNPV